MAAPVQINMLVDYLVVGPARLAGAWLSEKVLGKRRLAKKIGPSHRESVAMGLTPSVPTQQHEVTVKGVAEGGISSCEAWGTNCASKEGTGQGIGGESGVGTSGQTMQDGLLVIRESVAMPCTMAGISSINLNPGIFCHSCASPCGCQARYMLAANQSQNTHVR